LVDVIFRGKKIKHLEAEAAERFKRSCDKNQITYIEDIEHNNLIVLPDLEEKTIVIRLLSNEQELLDLAKSLKKELLLNGATVIIDDKTDMNKELLRLSDEQILFCISENSDLKTREVVLYSSFVNANHYDEVIKNLYKHFVEDFSGISFNVAGILKKLTNIKYWSYLFSASNSNLLIAFDNAETVVALREKLPKWLAECFIFACGRSHRLEEYCVIDKILEEIIDSIAMEKDKDEEKRQMKDIGSGLKELLENVESVSQQLAVLSPQKAESPATEPVPKTAKQNPQIPAKLRKVNPKPKVNNRTMVMSSPMSRYPFTPPTDCPVYRYAYETAPQRVPFVPTETPSLSSLPCEQNSVFSRSISHPAQKTNVGSEEEVKDDTKRGTKEAAENMESSKDKKNNEEIESIKLETIPHSINQIKETEDD
jgi:hypothetical protein